MKVYQYIKTVEYLHQQRVDLKELLTEENISIESKEIYTLLLNTITQELDKLTIKYANAKIEDRFFNNK